MNNLNVLIGNGIKDLKNLNMYATEHEKDMFMVMSKPILETIFDLWESVEDEDILLR
jgi:hypothetical protein